MYTSCCIQCLPLWFLQGLQNTMDVNKTVVVFINLKSTPDLLQSQADSGKVREFQEGLEEMNTRWDRLSTSLEDWREELQRALMQCQVVKHKHTPFCLCKQFIYRYSCVPLRSSMR